MQHNILGKKLDSTLFGIIVELLLRTFNKIITSVFTIQEMIDLYKMMQKTIKESDGYKEEPSFVNKQVET